MVGTDGENIAQASGENDDHGSGGAESRGSVWSSPGGTAQIILNVILVALAAINIYWITSVRSQLEESSRLHEDQYTLLTRRLDSSDDQFARMSGDLKVAHEKLGLTTEELQRARAVTASVRKQQQQAVKQLSEAIAQKASAEELNRLQTTADERFTTLTGDIEKTNDALSGAKSELSGSIARTHDELLVLARKSDRDFFEFTLPRKGAREKVGGVMIQLAKTDTKRNRFTVDLFFDDKRVQQRDRALMEPVLFYVGGASSPVELVVNQLSKNKISGYVSTPRGLYAGVPNVLTERPGL
ncbi:MAG: hypothetical protein HY508_13785 [Acidobacteria bacterium]|nr:hypothetical protein [Acidobacteriota bacterium]